MKTSRLLLILSAPLLFILLESFLLWPKFLLGTEIIAILWILGLVRYFASQSSLGKKWLLNALLPILLYVSLSFSAAILINSWLIQVIFIFLLVFLIRYFQVLYGWLVKNDLKQINRLPNFSLSGGLLIIFSAISNIYSLQVFVSWPTGWLFGLSVLVIAFVTYNNWQACQLNIKENLTLFLVINILLAETVAILFFWPFNYQVLALIVTLVYYVLINCTRLYLSAALDKRKIQLYLIFSAAFFVFLILSTRWF
ncbi:MAG: hypothetical protein NTX66_03990 [Candidatus Falkowbacteria bacterium]|nr:hypothetical protein [Candidatus Falkowbacteria bacterium]